MGRAARLPAEPCTGRVESLSHDGRGVAHLNGKAVFIHGALPGEEVRFRYTRIQRRFDEGVVEEVLEPAAERVEPRCPHFGVCGGCSLQHLDSAAQLRAKQQVLIDALERIGGVRPGEILPPLLGPVWGYRRKARIGVKYVAKKGKVLVGFRERGSSFVADLSCCPILHPQVGERIADLGRLVDALSIRDQVPQIEVSMGDAACVLLFRVLAAPSAEDCQRLLNFGQAQGFHIYLQPAGPDSITPLPGQEIELSYRLPRFDLDLAFGPTDFTQVNTELNRLMVDRAVGLLDPQSDERVLDLFCGLGNFTLPLAKRSAWVTGVEGEGGLIDRARRNAARNGLNNLDFQVADLYKPLEGEPWIGERFDKALLDPPRSGAWEILPWLPGLGVRRLVYVSCYPSTLARDSGRLVGELGYRLVAAGVMDMFPHTGHVETLALFESKEKKARNGIRNRA